MRSNLTTTLTRAESARLAINANQPHHRSIQTQNIEDGDLPFSEILLFLEELGADAGLAIETAQMKLFDLESLISLNILHDNDNNVIKAEKIPRNQELYRKRAVVVLPIQELPSHAPTLRRKPNGLVQQLIIPERKSPRELALESLVLHLRASSASGISLPLQPLLEHVKLSTTRKRAIEALAQKGWDMRQLGPHRRVGTTDKQRCDCSFVPPREDRGRKA